MNIDFSALNFTPPPHEGSITPSKEMPRIYTLDAETDPFKHGEMVWPFAWGLYDGENFSYTWGDNCTDEIEEILLNLEPGIVYLHNGGKFDIYFLIRLILGNKALVINRRIVRAVIKLPRGGQLELRDSYAIMPFPLRKLGKDEIDYDKMRRDVREYHKPEILQYLKRDCVSLWDATHDFVGRFGPRLTIGSLAMDELKKLHKFEPLGPYADLSIRKDFYYGGRVECFQRGILRGPFQVHDVNSMFPFAMKSFLHPMEMPGAETVRVRQDTCFITVEGKNYGAFPQRTKNRGIRFDADYGVFHVTRHEFDTALRLNLFEPHRIIRCINYRDRRTLAEFVDKYYQLRKQAKDSGDYFGTIFYKYILNSAYGKFAQNPDKYQEWKIDTIDSPEPSRGKRDKEWTEGVIANPGNRRFEFKIWMRDSPDFSRYNIAVGASITGAARAVLLEAIASADTPVYCDTDSLICKGLRAKVDSSELGAWKVEAEGAEVVMVAGRKLYAVARYPKLPPRKRGHIRSEFGIPVRAAEGPIECVKLASKGVEMDMDKIRRLCMGETVTYRRDAPTFHLDGSVTFIERRINMTD